jgi:hypothetical protein
MADPQADERLEQVIELHRAAIEAFNRGDLDGTVASFPEDFEWHAVSEDPETSVLRGPAEVKKFFEGFRDVFDEWRSDPLEYRRLDDSTAYIHHVLSGTSRGAGVPVKVDAHELWDIDIERLEPRRVRQFLSRDEAMAAFEGD